MHPGAFDACYDDLDADCAEDDDFDCDGDGHVPDDLVDYPGTLPQDDCDDDDGEVRPGAADVCYDGLDSDCGGQTADEDYDCDGDGHVPPGTGYTGTLPQDDCDDGDGEVVPGAADACYDGVDSDCGGDDDFDCDGDGHAADDQPAYTGSLPPDDCADDDATVHPGATETPYDGIDSDCDGSDPCDVDADGFDALACGGADCDDADPSIRPDAAEVPGDDVDQDCDGVDATDDPEVTHGDCGCDTGTAPGGWLVVVLAFVGLRRRGRVA